MKLKEILLRAGKTRWLDVGSGGNRESGFIMLDYLEDPQAELEPGDIYHQIDILHPTQQDFSRLGVFDLVRMQHVLEHFSYEDGHDVLLNVSNLLSPGGWLVVTVPDLRIHIQKYLTRAYHSWNGFKWWANKRIPESSPASFYFSIFAHSMPYQQHKWCYDYEGVEYQINRVNRFFDIRPLSFTDPLAEFPFTHNRPEEDLCVIAQRRNRCV